MFAIHHIKSSFAIVCLCLLSLSAYAEQKKQLGDWEVHYIVFNSSFLAASVAQQYDIERSKRLAVVNISVLDSKQKLKPALDTLVSGSAKNLIGQTQSLEFKKVQEGNAIYYISNMRFDDQDLYTFNIEIGEGKQQQSFSFQQKLYVD
ncbi:DUF4426 domain-containing protein [Alginatibacterium sediminis]|uniref:DUF4426 domain-containing protein n=1 Tax=Alginatibacterium sediminis TaxID=2164068 RepID=A0A420E810_9ALTE|nr:DUF4426 domain-containing protein [Alginatibacterium sediminis]RKF15669.1 DUF4426 domain-containing protein [Alginatibacterium sediminis]